MTAPKITCVECGAELADAARFCQECGADQTAVIPGQGISPLGIIATSALIGILGMILIPGAIVTWDATSSNTTTEAAAIFASLAMSVLALGAIAANVAFLWYLASRDATNWLWGTQGFIVLAWSFASIATIAALAGD